MTSHTHTHTPTTQWRSTRKTLPHVEGHLPIQGNLERAYNKAKSRIAYTRIGGRSEGEEGRGWEWRREGEEGRKEGRGWDGRGGVIIVNHYCQCVHWPVRCPNFCEPYRTLKQYTVDKHVEEECPVTVVACKFAEVGCEVKVKRKDLPQHMQGAMMDHLTSLFTDYVKLKKELDHLKSQKK